MPGRTRHETGSAVGRKEKTREAAETGRRQRGDHADNGSVIERSRRTRQRNSASNASAVSSHGSHSVGQDVEAHPGTPITPRGMTTDQAATMKHRICIICNGRPAQFISMQSFCPPGTYPDVAGASIDSRSSVDYGKRASSVHDEISGFARLVKSDWSKGKSPGPAGTTSIGKTKTLYCS